VALVVRSNEYQHLSADTVRLLTRPVDERIQAIYNESYIPCDIGNLVHKRMWQLFKVRREIRGQGLLIWGEPNAGKSTIARGFQGQFPDKWSPDITFKPVVYMKCPNKPGENKFLDRFLQNFDPKCYGYGDKWARAENNAKENKVRMVIVDDFHDLIGTGSASSLRETLALVKDMMDEFHLSFVLTSVKGPEFVFEEHKQLGTRFYAVNVEGVKDGADFARWLKLVESRLPLPKSSRLASDEIRHYLIEATGGNRGDIVHTIREATRETVEQEMEYITRDCLQRNLAKSGTLKKA